MNRYQGKLPQQLVREDLTQIIRAQRSALWQRPLADHSVAAFASVRHSVESSARPLIIDSCCGTGDSTRRLAEIFPDALVVGIDKSAHRLARHAGSSATNYLMVRADVNDFWRLACDADWRPAKHYLLYPNPYPKASQFRKRWYGSPAFPTLIKLGGLLTIRTNWWVYAQELALALNDYGFLAQNKRVIDQPPISAFEKKYKQRGDDLYEVVIGLSAAT